MRMMKLIDMLPFELAEKADSKSVLLIPFGCIEFHGNHLPIGTDYFITCEMARLIEERTGAVTAPGVYFSPTGMAASGREKGTADFSVNSFIDCVAQLLENYIGMGFSRIICIVHHQGAESEAMIRTAFAKATLYNNKNTLGDGWWTRGEGPKNSAGLEIRGAFLDSTRFGGHGGRGETEAMLALRPELVKMQYLERGDFRWNWNKGMEADMSDGNEAIAEVERILDKWADIITDNCKA